jgi:hypothetical protein
MGPPLRRLAIVAIALVVIVVSIAWVSVTFIDRSFACGMSWGEARHGETLPAAFVDAASQPRRLGVLTTIGPHTRFVPLCRGQARGRLVESGTAIALALVGVGFAVRPRRKPDTDIAAA